MLDAQSTPFHDVPITRATTSAVERHLAERRPPGAGLDVGAMLLEDELRVSLDASGFDRHTFFCGQSGSGKTYALGTVLERLILDTDLRIVVLDPNSDFVRLGEVREGVGSGRRRAGTAKRRRDSSFGGARPRAASGCTCGSPTATPRSRPRCSGSIRSRIARSTARSSTCSTADSRRRRPVSATSPRACSTRRTRRPGRSEPGSANLGLHRWPIWSVGDDGSVQDLVQPGGPRVAIVDLGSLQTPGEKAIAAESVLAALWRRRAVARADPDRHRRGAQRLSARARRSGDRARERARGADRGGGAEVRALPARVDAAAPARERARRVAVRQPRADADDLRRPTSRTSASSSRSPRPRSSSERRRFGAGESLVAGKIASHPTFVRFGPRVSEEGGADVPTSWARPAQA